jgi:hypothetical protein
MREIDVCEQAIAPAISRYVHPSSSVQLVPFWRVPTANYLTKVVGAVGREPHRPPYWVNATRQVCRRTYAYLTVMLGLKKDRI